MGKFLIKPFAAIVAIFVLMLSLPECLDAQSAIKQLETLSGGKISTAKTSDHRIVTPAPKSSSSSSSSSSFSSQHAIGMQLAGGLISALFSSLTTNTNDNASAEKAAEQKAAADREAAVQAIALANKLSEQQRYKDSAANESYVNLMKEYKTMDNQNAVSLKQLSSGDLELKAYEDKSSAFVRSQVVSSWNYGEWASVNSSDNAIREAPSVDEPDEADKFLDDLIDKVDSFEGGKIAVLTGRFMKNIKNETMSYLKDASDAVISGDVYKMEELGRFDNKKLVINAVLNTGKESVKKYLNSIKDDLEGKMKDKVEDKVEDAAFGVLKDSGLSLLKKYDIYSPIGDEWKVKLTKR